MSHNSRRAPPIECPLASLGHNGPSSTAHQPYHHPLSSSPLNPDVYQMSRTSPILNISSEASLTNGSTAANSGVAPELNWTLDRHAMHFFPTLLREGHAGAVYGGGGKGGGGGGGTAGGTAEPHDNDDTTSESSSHIIYSNQSSFTRNASKNKNMAARKIYRQPVPCNNNYNTEDSDSTSFTHQAPAPGRCELMGSNAGGQLNDSIGSTTGTYHIGPHNRNLSRGAREHSEQYFLENKMRKFYIHDDETDFAKAARGGERYYLEDNLDERIDNASPSFLRRPSSPSETSESDRYLIGRISRESPAPPLNGNARRAYNFLVNHHRTHPGSLLMEGLSRLGRTSPNLDQGYHTLASPSPSAGNSHPLANVRNRTRHETPFNKLSDDVIIKIFSYVDSCDLCNISKVCKRFEALVWRPFLWKSIKLKGEYINGDRALRSIFRRLSMQTRNVACPEVERVLLSEGCRVTDKGLELLSRRCPELTHLQIQMSFNITHNALFNLVTKCTNLQHLDVTACSQIATIDFNQSLDPPRRLLLQFLDLTDCCLLDDVGLKTIVQNCPQLVYLYLRRCTLISDIGLKFVPSYCTAMRELSVSDCANITDFGLYELAKLGATLRYLSVAKCDQVSDAGLKVIARRCYKLRYLNARGCEAVSDDSITMLAHSCPRLRALDIGKCDVSDVGLHALAESCPNLKKLSLKNCDMITDRGIQCIAYYCRGLQNLNIQDCQITLEGYRAVKKYCKRCVIEHTNPGFC